MPFIFKIFYAMTFNVIFPKSSDQGKILYILSHNICKYKTEYKNADFFQGNNDIY